METLHLNLKKKWFDMIRKGIKTEEYRDCTQYWLTRLQNACKAKVMTITFSNGYAKNRQQFTIEWLALDKKKGKRKWGAEKGVEYYVLKLGKVLQER